MIYELVPGLDVEFARAPLRTNAGGFRGPSVPEERAGRSVRILGLGDSVMFGWGVRYEECYLALLRDRLARRFPAVSWEVVNAAVPGYNAVMEVESLKDKGLALRPDLVIINFVGNDLGLPNFVLEPEDYWSLRRSFLLEFVRSRRGGPHLVPVPVEGRRFGLEGTPDRVPARYREMVGLDSYRRAMNELGALAAGQGFGVTVLAHPEAPSFVKEIALGLGFPLVETQAALAEYRRAYGIAQERGWPLTITEVDPHPSPLGHEIIAQVLFEDLEGSGTAARLAGGRP